MITRIIGAFLAWGVTWGLIGEAGDALAAQLGHSLGKLPDVVGVFVGAAAFTAVMGHGGEA